MKRVVQMKIVICGNSERSVRIIKAPPSIRELRLKERRKSWFRRKGEKETGNGGI
jgi:hypothetical protein